MNWLKSLFKRSSYISKLTIDHQKGEWWIQGINRDGSSDGPIASSGKIKPGKFIETPENCFVSVIEKKESFIFKERLPQDDLNDAFSVANDNPFFVAVLQLLGDHIEDATNLATAMKTSETPGFVAHAAGQTDALIQFRQAMIDLQQTHGEKL